MRETIFTTVASLGGGTIGLIVFGVVLLALILWAVGAYNGLVRLRNLYKNAFAQIDVQLFKLLELHFEDLNFFEDLCLSNFKPVIFKGETDFCFFKELGLRLHSSVPLRIPTPARDLQQTEGSFHQIQITAPHQ